MYEAVKAITFLLLLSLQLYDHYERTGRRLALVASFFVLGLGASNHVLTFFAGPAAVLYYLLSGGFKRETGLKLRWLWLPSLAFLAGFSPYLIQFARMLRTFPVSQVMGPVVGSTFLRGLTGTTPLLLLASTLTFLAILESSSGHRTRYMNSGSLYSPNTPFNVSIISPSVQ